MIEGEVPATEIMLLATKQETEAFIENTWANLNQMRKSGIACDAELITEDGVIFPIHRLVLIACSPYFKTAFTTRLVGMSGDSDDSRTSILVPGVSAEMLKLIVEYAYSLYTPVDYQTVGEILQTADQFCIEGMIQDCRSFLRRQLSLDSCIHIWQCAKRYYDANLLNLSFKYILKGFQKISLENLPLLKLPSQALLEILESDALVVKNEYHVWRCIRRWLSYDIPARLHLLSKLLNSIRFGLLSLENFLKIANHSLIKNNESCAKVMNEACNVINTRSTTCIEDLAYFGKMARVRLPWTFIICLGGWSGTTPTDVVAVYDKNVDVWTMLPDGDSFGRRAYHQIQQLNDTIYVVGGTNGHNSLNSCHAFNLSSRTWKQMADMRFPRCYLSSVVLCGSIYVMGGFNGRSRLSTVEKYDPSINAWYSVQEMQCKRSDASACVLLEKILVCGGFNGSNYLNTAEIYDPQRNQWSFIAPMSSKRSGLSCVTYGSRGCVVLGGFNGLMRLASVEVYDIITDRWTSKPSMHSPRSNFYAVVLDGSIYVCGGYDGITTISSVEKFDISTHHWNFVGKLTITCSALAGCVIKDLENRHDFLPKQRTISYDKIFAKNAVNVQHGKKHYSYPFARTF